MFRLALSRRHWKFVQNYADAKTAVVEAIVARAREMTARNDGLS